MNSSGNEKSDKTIKELDRIVLTEDLPEEDLTAGEEGTVVHVYVDCQAFEVEFILPDDSKVVTVQAAQIRPL